MLDLAIPSPHSQKTYAVSPPNPAHAFLLKSERRVILHCEKMLAANGLPDDQRRRLTQISNEAIGQLQQLER
jgi:hypothetical protein